MLFEEAVAVALPRFHLSPALHLLQQRQLSRVDRLEPLHVQLPDLGT